MRAVFHPTAFQHKHVVGGKAQIHMVDPYPPYLSKVVVEVGVPPGKASILQLHSIQKAVSAATCRDKGYFSWQRYVPFRP